jgi:hypothetical protein
MGEIQLVAADWLTQLIAERIRKIWDAYMAVDASGHNELLAEDYSAVHPDGSFHLGRPTAQQIAAAPIAGYWLTGMQTWPITGEVALARYQAEVEAKSAEQASRFRSEVGQVGVEAKSAGQGLRFRFAVGEMWVKRGGMWKCRYYQATMLS